MENKIYEKVHGGRKKIFFDTYDPKVSIDVRKTAKSFGVSDQAVYKWLKEYKAKNN
jgi:transposase-like protein